MPFDIFAAESQTMRLSLEAEIDIPEGGGRTVRTYSAVASVWARVLPVQEPVEQDCRPPVTHRIWLQHSSRLQAGMRFRRGARLFAIVSLHDPDDSGRYLVCHVTEE